MLEVKNLVKVYKTKGGVETRALDGVSVNFPEKGLVFLLGKSGSGKSTLLNMIGGLDRPDSGEIVVKGRSSKDFSQADFDSYRNTYIGFIFQEYNVLNEFNIEQNISLALQLQGKKNDKDAVNALLKEVDLEGFNKRKPNTLSGGQKQRIAIARALIKQPEIIMADEPTGALDSNTGKQVLETLKKLSKTKLVIIVSHDQDFAEEYGDRIIELKDGKIISDKSKEVVPPQALNEKMQIINGNIIDIKKGSALTEADFKQLYQIIKKQDKEVLIATGDENIKTAKKAARISDSGNGERFTNTKEVVVKKYDGKNTKFIRSHMPFSRSFKMGASGLKTKPVRLIFTILLSVVSFTMFGVASTLMFYNPSYSLAIAMENVERKSEGIGKKYKYTQQSYRVNSKTGEKTPDGDEYERQRYTYFGANELDELNASSSNRYIGVFNFYSLPYDKFQNEQAIRFKDVSVSDDTENYYSFNYFNGLSDADASFFSNHQYQLTGSHPVENDEIAISNYHYELLKASGNYGNISNESQLIGKRLTISMRTEYSDSKSLDMKIVGIYNFGPLSTKYVDLKDPTKTPAGSVALNNLKEGFEAYLVNSLYTTGYVGPDFYDEYGFIYEDSNTYVNTTYLKGFDFMTSERAPEDWPVDQDSGRTAFTIEKLKSATGIKYYNSDLAEVSEPIDIGDNEVLLPYEQNAGNAEYYKYCSVPQKMYNALYSCRGNTHYTVLDNFVNQVENHSFEDEESLAATYNRLITSFEKAEKEDNSYPSDYDIDADLEKVTNGFNEMYAIATRNYYLNCMDGFLSQLIGYEDDPDIILGRNALESGAITDEQALAYQEAMEVYIEANPELKAVEYVTASTLFNLTFNENRNNINDKVRETFPPYNSFEEVLSEYSAQHSDDKFMSSFMDILNFVSLKVLGATPDTYTYNPNIITGFSIPEKQVSNIRFFAKGYDGEAKEYTIKGYFDVGRNGDRNAPAFTTKAIEKYIDSNSGKDDYYYTTVYKSDYVQPKDAKYAFLISPTEYSEADIDLFTKDFGTYRFTMTNSAYNVASTWTDMIQQLQLIFLIVGAVTGGLSALLLLNFISVSISSKNKDIGILRAVGARGSDVFKIFFSESSIIATICFILSAVAAGVVCFYINNMVKSTILGIGLLNYGFINVLLILGISIVISFIATFIPVVIASKKPPVEAIRAL